jgi:DnaK suppressor protein
MGELMDTNHFKEKLLQKESELVSVLARFEDEARAAADIDVRDNGDWATLDEDTWISIEEAEVASQTLREVREALQRIENGTYGKCISCGRPIEPDRLEAVPWTPFCRKDQKKADARRPTPVGSTL